MGKNMKSIITYSAVFTSIALSGFLSSPVFAHTGHIEVGPHGHSHLLALGAICAALVIGGFGLLHNIKVRKLNARKSS